MALLDGILGKRKKTIDGISLDELNMTRVKLSNEQERIMRRVSDLEKQKEALFQQGVNEPSKRRQMLLAQKIQELELQAKNYDRNLTAYSKQMRVLNGLIFLKENRRSWEDTAVGQVLGNMDLADLEGFVDQATANNIFQMDKFERLLGTLEESGDMTGGATMDEGISEIMDQFQKAREAGSMGAELGQFDQSVDVEPPESS